MRWLIENQFENGQFVYYYDAATDSRRDHEHPKRDPEKNPYYNLLRHGGAGLTLLFCEELRQRCLNDASLLVRLGDADLRLDNRLRLVKAIQRTCDWFVEQLVPYKTTAGEDAAYPLFNRKAKLGGAGIGLYMLA